RKERSRHQRLSTSTATHERTSALCAATHVPVYRFPLRRLAQDVQTSAEAVKPLFPRGPVQHQSNPAPRAHLYFAPSTSTGISVATGYAGTLRSNMSADASPTSTSTARA